MNRRYPRIDKPFLVKTSETESYLFKNDLDSRRRIFPILAQIIRWCVNRHPVKRDENQLEEHIKKTRDARGDD